MAKELKHWSHAVRDLMTPTKSSVVNKFKLGVLVVWLGFFAICLYAIFK